jgi:hypothetical protein
MAQVETQDFGLIFDAKEAVAFGGRIKPCPTICRLFGILEATYLRPDWD